MAVRSGSRHAGKRITGKKNVRQAIQAQTRLTSVTIICTCIIAQKGNVMEKNWKAKIEQKRKVVYLGEASWYKETFELRFETLVEAQVTVNALMSAWPYDFPPMKVTITNIIPEAPKPDVTIPDTDFMEGGEQ